MPKRVIIFDMFSNTFTLTKRHLGILMVLGGILGFISILAIDVLDFGREGGIGPAQRIALGGCIAILIIGLTLLPLRDQDA